MYPVGGVLRRQIYSCKVTGVAVLNLQTSHISKIPWKTGARCLITGNVPVDTLFSKQRQLPTSIQQQRTLSKESLSDIIMNFDDDVPKEFELIHIAESGNGVIMNYFIIGIFVLATSFTIGYVLMVNLGCWNIKFETTFAGITANLPTYKMFLISQVLITFLLWAYKGVYISRLPVQRIYENPNKQEFIAVLRKGAVRTEKLEFTAGDIRAMSRSERSMSKVGNVSIKGREFLLYPGDFFRPRQYYQLLAPSQESQASETADNSIKSDNI